MMTGRGTYTTSLSLSILVSNLNRTNRTFQSPESLQGGRIDLPQGAIDCEGEGKLYTLI